MPSPAAHMLSGLLIAVVPAIAHRKYSRNYFAIGILAAASPDLDMLLVYAGVDYFVAHRTFSHSLPFAIGVTILLWSINIFFKRTLKNTIKIPYKLLGACLICHIIMDLLGVDVRGPQGLMLGWPFSDIFLYPDIGLYPSTTDMLGNIPSLYSLFKITIKEMIITFIIGLPVLGTVFLSYPYLMRVTSDNTD